MKKNSGCCSCWGFFNSKKDKKTGVLDRQIQVTYREDHKEIIDKQTQRKAEQAKKAGYKRF